MVTVWFVTMEAWSEYIRYARRYIGRSESVSSFWLVPAWGTQLPHACTKLATVRSGISVTVEEFGLTKFGATLYIRKDVVVSKVRKYAGVPSTGGVAPSR